MIDLSSFPITQKWPARNPEAIQFYSFPTPNGIKVSVALEELGLVYEPHRVTLVDANVKSSEFLSLNPNNKIPAIIDPHGPDGAPLGLFESGAILIYLAEKTGKLIGNTACERAHVIQWLMFQMGGVGPMFGQLGYFTKWAGVEIEDPRPRARYVAEAKRLLAVMEQAMAGKSWIVDEFSIADIALVPWLNGLESYGVRGILGWDDHPNIVAWHKRFYARPAVERGKVIPAEPPRQANL